MKHDTLKAWSEEQLIQCDDVDSGCNGGMMEYAMKYIISVDGVDTEVDYPYLSCTFSGSTYCVGDYQDECLNYTNGDGLSELGRVSSWYFISYNDAYAEPEIKRSLFNVGPLSCAINAYPMLDYTSGIDDPSDCGDTFSDLNHGVAFVGFGNSSTNSTQYWLIKNSWGSDWGEAGYYRIVYGSNECGLSLYVLHSVSIE